MDRFLGRLLPQLIRREAFEPAVHDIRHRAIATRRSRAWVTAQLVILYCDCLRIAVFPARAVVTAQLPHSHRPFSLKGQVTHMWQDIRHAFRRLAHERAFTTAAILTLTLGVGANVAVFAVVEAVLLRPLPYADADRLVILNHRDERTSITKEFIAVGDFIDLAAKQTVFEDFAAFNGGKAVIYGEGEPIVATSLAVGPGLLETLRIKAAQGRLINNDDIRQGAAPVAMLGHRLWERDFKGDPNIVGRRIRIGNTEREIVGIAPQGFLFPPNADGGATDLIVPFPIPAAAPTERKSMWVFGLARLRTLGHGDTEKDGGLGAANVQLTSLSQQFERDFPAQNQGSRYFGKSLRDAMVGDTKKPLTMLAFAVGAVLLIACANVGNLLLVRALGRQQEMAVRAALGASRGRMVGQVLTESFVLALVSALGGIAIAYWGTPALAALVPDSVNAPGLADAGLNVKVLGFAVAIATAAALGFGFVSAMTTGRPAAAALATTSVGRAGVSRSVRRLTSSLVVVEIALAVVLLLGAGLILRSFAGLMSVDPGFSIDRVVSFDLGIPGSRYRDVQARADFYNRALGQLKTVSGVEAAGMAAVTPLTGNNWTIGFERADRPMAAGQRRPDVGWQNASGGYFKALGIPLKSGRLFDERDGPGSAPVVIISEAIERRFFAAGESAVGHFVNQNGEQMEIVGVVGNIRRAALTDEPRMDMYLPFERQPGPGITMFVKTTGDPSATLPSLRAAVRAIEPNVVMINDRTLADTALQSVGTTRLVLWLLAVFAAIALALAGVGIYGVLAHAVRLRTREIGTRLALGARPADVLWLVIRWGAALALAGVLLGGAVGLLAATSIKSMLYGVTTTDPRVIAAVTCVLIVTVLIAAAIPARRASRIDPARTLSS